MMGWGRLPLEAARRGDPAPGPVEQSRRRRAAGYINAGAAAPRHLRPGTHERQRMGSPDESIVHGLIAEAVALGADTIQVEYRDGYEEVCVLKGGVGFEIARWPSSGRPAVLLRKELGDLRKKRAKATVGGAAYEIRTRIYDSFGETAFEVRLRRI
jgi:hypothetical protein